MKKRWLSLGFRANEICNIRELTKFKAGEILPYIHDIHFAHYNSKLLSSGRPPTKYSKLEVKSFLEICSVNGINTTLLLNSGNYEFHDIIKALENFYLPLGINAVVISDTNLSEKIRKFYPKLKIYGSCISYIDTVDGLLNEKEKGIDLHNPATWTIRNEPFIKEISGKGLKQKQIATEGCARKCKLEYWHRAESTNSVYHDLEKTCKKGIPDIYTFLMGSWVTMKQLKRMENYIDVLKLPRGTFEKFSDIYRLIRLYDSNEPYNIFDFLSIPLKQIKHNNIIMSDIFDDAFFDNTISDTVDYNFLDYYISKLDKVPFFKKEE